MGERRLFAGYSRVKRSHVGGHGGYQPRHVHDRGDIAGNLPQIESENGLGLREENVADVYVTKVSTKLFWVFIDLIIELWE